MSNTAAASRKVIALDYDDCMTMDMAFIVQQLNKIYDLDLTLDDCESNMFYLNRGSVIQPINLEVLNKFSEIGKLRLKPEAPPNLTPSIHILRQSGYKLHILTARSSISRPGMVKWLADKGISVGEGMDIEDIHFTRHNDEGAEHATLLAEIEGRSDLSEDEKNEEIKRIMIDQLAAKVKSGTSPLTKLEAAKAIGASVFIDDQHQNFVPFLEQSDIQCLLFGEYKHNQNNIDFSHPHDYMTWEERQKAGVQLHLRPIVAGGNLHRVKDWDDVVQWVESWEKDRNQIGESDQVTQKVRQ